MVACTSFSLQASHLCASSSKNPSFPLASHHRSFNRQGILKLIIWEHTHPTFYRSQLPSGLCHTSSTHAEAPCHVSPNHTGLATALSHVSPTQTGLPNELCRVGTPHAQLRSTNGATSISQTELPHGLNAHHLPRHVAIIMDGNSRWAERQGLLHTAGHEAGYKSLKQIIKLSCDWGIQALTVFAFSTENWRRPQGEVSFLMKLFHKVVAEELENFVKANIQVHIIGDVKCFPTALQLLVQELEQKTAHNTGLKFTVAASYGGRYDIVRACQQIAAKVQQGKLSPGEITESHLEKELGTSWLLDSGDPDLLIRTGGEQRLSNFLLWQLAYTELLFLDVMWPDIDEIHYADALLYYQRRSRRFGVRSKVSAG